MAYTLAQFITQATAGGAVQVTKVAGPGSVLLEIGGRSIILNEAQTTKVAPTDGGTGEPTAAITNTTVLDLGTLFSANQVLESASLRKAISDGVVTAVAGTIELSKVPVV